MSNTDSALGRLEALFDNGEFTQLDAYAKSADGEVEVVAGFGSVNGTAVYAFSQDKSIGDGAFTVAQCAKIKKVYDLALKTGCPVVGIYDSNGVKLTEGFEVLNAYGELIKASSAMSGVCPQISLVAGSCLGSAALIANMADIVVAVKDADFYVTVPSEVTALQSANEGTVDILAQDVASAINCVRDAVALLPSNNLDCAPIFDFSEKVSALGADSTAEDIVSAIADEGSLLELKSEYADNSITALASVMGSSVGIVAFRGNALCPSCIYKAEALVKLCDAYSLPIITVVNADGVIREKENQLLTALTKLTTAYAGATCPKISVITGNAVGSAYITLAGRGANADYVISWDSAVISPLEADSAVAFLYNDRLAQGEDRAALEAEYKDTIASPFTAAACGAVDSICAPQDTRKSVISALDMLSGKRENTLPRKHSVK